MSMIFIEIDKIRNVNTKNKFQNELADLENKLDPNSQDRCIKLKKILEKYTVNNSNKNNLSTHFDLINKMAVSKQWSKLYEYHKIEKILEFITTLYSTHPHLTKIKKKVRELVEGKHLNTSKLVAYDSVNAKVTSISKLIVDENGNVSLK